MPRTLPRSLAPIVEDLELDQPKVVTLRMLAELVARHDVGTDTKVVAARLRERGWLLKTGTRGVWEFAPGSHAGAYGNGDPVLPLQAVLAVHPQLPAALALNTAAWAWGYADRVPTRLDVAVPTLAAAPSALLAQTNVMVFRPALEPLRAKGAPVHRPESVVAHLASSPDVVRSWGAVLEWLPDLAGDLSGDALQRELCGRSRAVRVRAGYLLAGLRPDLAEPLHDAVRDPVRFGPRQAKVRRYARDWRVIDSLLPVDPRMLEAAA